MAVRIYQLARQAFPTGQPKVLVDYLTRRRWWVKAGYAADYYQKWDPVVVELLLTIRGLHERIEATATKEGTDGE